MKKKQTGTMPTAVDVFKKMNCNPGFIPKPLWPRGPESANDPVKKLERIGTIIAGSVLVLVAAAAVLTGFGVVTF